MSTVRYIKRSQIDTEQWDACVTSGYQGGMIYGLSWYLDIVTNGCWDALIVGDYESVFPLPWARKWKVFKFWQQPLLTQQLGWFGKTTDSQTLSDIISQIPNGPSGAVLCLNEFNPVPDCNWATESRPNLLLSLNPPYEDIRKGYSSNHERSVRKAAKYNLTAQEEAFGIDAFLNEVRTYHDNKNNHIPGSLYPIARRLLNEAVKRGHGFFTVVRNPAKEVIAAIFFLCYTNRIIDLMNFCTPEGRDCRAMHFAIDRTIAQYSASGLTLDFEGSTISSVADFYRGFGSGETHYVLLRK